MLNRCLTVQVSSTRVEKHRELAAGRTRREATAAVPRLSAAPAVQPEIDQRVEGHLRRLPRVSGPGCMEAMVQLRTRVYI